MATDEQRLREPRAGRQSPGLAERTGSSRAQAGGRDSPAGHRRDRAGLGTALSAGGASSPWNGLRTQQKGPSTSAVEGPCCRYRDGGIRTRDPLNPMPHVKLRDFYKLLNLRAVLGIGVAVEGPSGAPLSCETHNRTRNRVSCFSMKKNCTRAGSPRATSLKMLRPRLWPQAQIQRASCGERRTGRDHRARLAVHRSDRLLPALSNALRHLVRGECPKNRRREIGDVIWHARRLSPPHRCRSLYRW